MAKCNLGEVNLEPMQSEVTAFHVREFWGSYQKPLGWPFVYHIAYYADLHGSFADICRSFAACL